MRFWPTPGESTTHGMSCFSSSALDPIPDRRRIAGLQYAPPQITTSFFAWYVLTPPLSVSCTSTPRATNSPDCVSGSTSTWSTVLPVTTVTFLRVYPLVTKSALVVRRPLYTDRRAWPHPCGVSPVENISGTCGKPSETKEDMMSCEMGARSCGSVWSGPS